jgi:uncharacterized membrane protein
MTDRRMEDVIANLLRLGVALAAALVLAGGVWYVASSARAVPDYARFHPEAWGPRAFAALSSPEKLMAIGLLVLIATPIARVAFALAAFALERDRMYVWFTAAVLGVLAYSIGTALF